MTRLVTNLVEERGWLRIHRVGRMLIADCEQPCRAYQLSPNGALMTGVVRRVCLHEECVQTPPNSPQTLPERTVARLLGWEPEEVLVRRVNGNVARAGLAYRHGPSLRVFVVAIAAPLPLPQQGPRESGAPECERGSGQGESEPTPAPLVGLHVFVVLDRPPRHEVADVLDCIAREAALEADDPSSTHEAGDTAKQPREALTVTLLHPEHHRGTPSSHAESPNEALQGIGLAVNEASCDARALRSAFGARPCSEVS
ncbi:hypothetical protein [Gephyromycinifex aptenodytis]|uniref:hypothetical protein n=1 Tax=Gephyromycinifex aptenodytis TaxID=2716227 RepID=UPI0014485799|nr:hypothetical protein [Gephyromycinifex aptenodytis]